ncbi:MAG: TAXI family TRAP transporter solute-binding subunit [Chloroflexi bacterium]|nr:TAXI family TRAP transporter solute-binding subunit [Chloroflexota bacterium]
MPVPVLLALLAVASCTHVESDDAPRVNLITGSTGSSWYSIGSAIAERTNLAFEGHPITAVPGAGGISNPARIARAPGDLGLSFLPFLRAAYRGDAPYIEAYPDLRHVATLIENKLHLLVSERLDAADFAEIRDRRLAIRVATGPPGSGEEFLLRAVMAQHGITYDDIRRWGGRIDLLGTGERADAWRDYRADIIAFSINDPAPVVAELLATRGGKLWPVAPEVRHALRETWRVRDLIIPPGTYGDQQEAIETIGLPFVVFTTIDVDSRLIYELTRTMAENKPYFDNVHAGFHVWEPHMMTAHDDVPLHEGAARYYRERGWIQ